MKRKPIALSIICLLLSLWCVPFVFAQYAAPDIDTRVAELTKSLNLTEDQVPKVHSILEKSREAAQKRYEEIRAQGRMDRNEMRNMMQEGQKALEDQLATVLTEEQLKTYKKNEEIRRANARSRMGRGMGMGQ